MSKKLDFCGLASPKGSGRDIEHTVGVQTIDPG